MALGTGATGDLGDGERAAGHGQHGGSKPAHHGQGPQELDELGRVLLGHQEAAGGTVTGGEGAGQRGIAPLTLGETGSAFGIAPVGGQRPDDAGGELALVGLAGRT